MKRNLTFRTSKLPFSFLISKRAVVWTLVLAAIVFAVLLISAGMGSVTIHPTDVFKVLIGQGSSRDTLIVQSFRLPRVTLALLIGAALGVSGAILQSIIRNPLASPDIVGITGGASVAAVFFITFLQTWSIQWLPVFSFAGAVLVTFLMYFLAWKNGVTPLRFVLVGIGIGSAMYAVTNLVIVMAPILVTAKSMIWLAGSVYGANWKSVAVLSMWLLLLLPVVFIYSRSINIQQLGDDLATGAGHAVQKHRFALLALCAALTGAAVAFGGAIGFVGLLAPHIARKLVGPSFGSLLPVTALTGALMVMLADLIGRTAFDPLDVPAGVFTALIGAPFFIYLLYKNRHM